MTDEKKTDLGLEDLDWDSAIAEWDQSTLVPEVARDKETQRAATLVNVPTPPPAPQPPPAPSSARTLYNPPKVTPPAEAIATQSALPELSDDPPDPDGHETLIAEMPPELRRSGGPQPRPTPSGGLAQLFKPRSGDQKDGEAFDRLFDEPSAEAARRKALERPATEEDLSETVNQSDSNQLLSLGVPREMTPEEALLDDLPGPDEYSDLSSATAETAHAGGAYSRTAAWAKAAAPDTPEDVTISAGHAAVLHAPAARQHDPDEETSALSRESVRRAMQQAALPSIRPIAPRAIDDEAPTRLRLAPASRAPSSGALPSEPLPAKTFEQERPATAWLDDDARTAHLARASWLELEARANADPTTCARGLLAVSELCALAGELEAAERFALEARELAPQLALGHWQARGLMPAPADTPTLVEALDAEIRAALTPAARLHATLLAADHLRVGGADEEASMRWDVACRLWPDDVRAATTRAASALAHGDHAHVGLRFGEGPELAPISLAVGTVLRMRGVERDDADSGEILANDSLRRARAALERGDVAAAALLIAELRGVPELSRGAAWLAAALGAVRPDTRAQAAQWVRMLLGTDDARARRALTARGVELGDGSLVDAALTGDDTFSAAERGILCALMKLPLAVSSRDLDAIGAGDEMSPLASALAAVSVPPTADDLLVRANRVAGTDSSRALSRLGRLLAADAGSAHVEAAIAQVAKDMPDGVRALKMEMSLRAGRYDELSGSLGMWSDVDEADPSAARDRQLAAALVAERDGDKSRALAAYRAAQHADPTSEVALRAIAELDPHTDLAYELGATADALGDGVPGAIMRLEAVTRAGGLDEEARNRMIEAAHQAARDLPFAGFLAERGARAAGDLDAVLKCIRDRRAASTDPLELALDALREALLVADRDPELAAERMAEAHNARPDDVALRELYERLATEAPTDRGAWREKRAASATGTARALLYTEAAYEYERSGDKESALRAAQAARASGDEGLGRLALERAEVEGGAAGRLADELLTLARSTENARERRESYERLADLDAVGRGDPASALLWHKTILESDPTYKPSLRYVEQVLLGEGRDDELEPTVAAIAMTLKGSKGGECGAHAEVGVRWHMRGLEDWETTKDLVDIASAQPDPSLWALRTANAHARHRRDDAAILATALALVPRTTRSDELAALHLRAAEAAGRLGDVEKSRELLERARTEDPGDIVAWGMLGDLRQRAGDGRGAAEASESLARTSGVPEHQLLAWYEAARLWTDAGDSDRAVTCLEQAAAIDVSFNDVFERLVALYTARGAKEGLAALLERRLEKITDPDERVAMQVERGRALCDIGDTDGARSALEAALEARPEHTGALIAFGDLCAAVSDWTAAETAWVRLARSLTTPEEQRTIYLRLGDLYAVHAVNLSRAEVAFKEVLKRSPDDLPTLERLVDVYSRQSDASRALEVQQQLIALAALPAERRRRLIGLAAIYDQTSKEPRKAEQTLEAARREFPGEVSVLRALAEFYIRHKQMPAVNILLDRAATDARRAFAAGRLTPGNFEVLAAVFDLRGKKDAATVIAATLSAFEGKPAALRGAEARASDPRLDDLLAPEVLTDALRALLYRTGDALDAASPLDLRALRAAALPATALGVPQIVKLAESMGIGGVQVLVSPQLGLTCVPCSSSPPIIVLGEALVSATDEAARTFLVTRALKLVAARASALVRTPAADLGILVAAWLQLFNPTWAPQGIPGPALSEARRRLQPGLPRQLDDDVGVMALEVAGSLGTQGATLGANALAWSNRTALLAVGDPNAALQGIAWSLGLKDGAPQDPEARAAWCAGTAEIKDVLGYSVTDAYAEARARLGLGK